MTRTEQILEDLIGFATVSRDSNLQLIDYIQTSLGELGIVSTLTYNEEKTKANLYAVFGPGREGGVMLSGHTDVVPVDGQDWTVDPFKLSLDNGRLFGRGTTDMKGFVASVLGMVEQAVSADLRHPIHLAFSYDEEIGCVGVKSMIAMLESARERPGFCIIGEPTSLQVAIAHKGKTGMVCRCLGVEGHSALAHKGLNAIYLATEMIAAIREIQQNIVRAPGHDNEFAVPYSTLHVGTINGGTALNIIPNLCEFKFELRNLKSDSPEEIIEQLRQAASDIVDKYRHEFPGAGIEIEIFNAYPALDTAPQEEVVEYVRSLADGNQPVKIDFGTEGGLFQHRLKVPTVVCGPGSMDQGHKPDEFIEQSQLLKCDAFLGRLLERLCVK